MAEPRHLDWTIVIPVKGTPAAKSRLGASPELVMAIALDSVEAALGVGRVIVVTTAEVGGTFAELGAVVVEDAGGGLIAACRQGIAAAGSGPTAVMLGDLPGLRSRELASALEFASRHPLAFVPDAEDDGTVLITALDAGGHAPAFGENSRAGHIAAGYTELPVAATSGLRRDVDTQQQLAAIPPTTLGPHTRLALSRISG
ncbi:MAG TPA: NTP transferase domain-containing protein [Galbitalea sp.]|nr:NTP transferase domain-containing protein [Galbitalea sp.]